MFEECEHTGAKRARWASSIKEYGRATRRKAFTLLALAAAVPFVMFSGVPRASALDSDNFKLVQGLGIYFGVLPAAMVRGHPKSHSEATMHGGAPGGIHEYHIVIAVFDDAPGARIEDAKVTASISGLGHVGLKSLALEPMSIAGTITYGTFVNLPGDDRYDIRVAINRPGQKAPAVVNFMYQHGR